MGIGTRIEGVNKVFNKKHCTYVTVTEEFSDKTIRELLSNRLDEYKSIIILVGGDNTVKVDIAFDKFKAYGDMKYIYGARYNSDDISESDAVSLLESEAREAIHKMYEGYEIQTLRDFNVNSGSVH